MITARSVRSDTGAVRCAAPGGSWPLALRAALRMKAWARSTAPAAMPAQAELQHRCATGIMVCAWIFS